MNALSTFTASAHKQDVEDAVNTVIGKIPVNSDSDIHEVIDLALAELGDNWAGWDNHRIWDKAMPHMAWMFAKRNVDLSPLCESHPGLLGPESEWCDGTCQSRKWIIAP